MLIYVHKLKTTMSKVRAAIQSSDEAASVLNERYATAERTLRKWSHRESVHPSHDSLVNHDQAIWENRAAVSG